MTEEPTPQASESSEAPPPNVPEDYRGYVKWRTTGEPPAEPAAEQQPPAAAEETPPAKSDPQSGAEKPQQSEEEDDEEESEPQSAAGRRAGQRQRKIDRLTREVNELKAMLAGNQPQPVPPKAEPPAGKPKLENFPTLEEYQEALTDWNIDQREAKREAEAQQKREVEAQQKLQTEWASKQQAARKAHADYDDVIEATKAPEGPGVAAGRQAMLEDPNGAEILYHLATHPEELKRIAELPPLGAVREVGRLSAILVPPVANGKPRLTAAPPPPPPKGRPAATQKTDLSDPSVVNDYRLWEKLRKAQLRNK